MTKDEEKKHNAAEMANFLRYLADLLEHKNEVLIDFVTIAHFNDVGADSCFTEAVGVFSPDGHLVDAMSSFIEDEEDRLTMLQQTDTWTGYLPRKSYPYHEN